MTRAKVGRWLAAEFTALTPVAGAKLAPVSAGISLFCDFREENFHFTSESDIDWSQSVAEIDKQLYAKYGLTEEEVGFIESMIKPM